MIRRRLLVVGVASLAVGLIVRRRRRARARIPLAIPFAALWAATRTTEIDFGYPGTVLQNIGGFFGSIITSVVGDIVGAVSNALTWALMVAQGWVSKAYDALNSIIGAVPAAIGSVVDYIEWAYNNFSDFLSRVGDEIYNGAVGAITDGLNVGGWLYGLLGDWLNSVLQATLAAGGWFYGFVADIVTDILQSALSVGSWIYDLISQIVSFVVDQLFADVGWLWDRLETFVNQLLYDGLAVGAWLYDWIKDNIVQPLLDAALAGFAEIVSVVRGAWDFLVWVAEHPLQWFEDLASSIVNLTGETILAALESAISGDEGTVESMLDRFFG